MSDVTRLLQAVSQGDASASAALLPLVYDELRRLARARMAGERAGHTLDATALVHEAYLRLVNNGNGNGIGSGTGTGDGIGTSDGNGNRDGAAGGVQPGPHWDGQRHFFAAAAEAMRRILVDHARRRAAVRHGGDRERVELTDDLPAISAPCEKVEDLLALDAALERLAAEDPDHATLVKLLFFAGLNLNEAAAALGLSRSTAYRRWLFARAWLHDAMTGGAARS